MMNDFLNEKTFTQTHPVKHLKHKWSTSCSPTGLALNTKHMKSGQLYLSIWSEEALDFSSTRHRNPVLQRTGNAFIKHPA